jgi:hypothetical protein
MARRCVLLVVCSLLVATAAPGLVTAQPANDDASDEVDVPPPTNEELENKRSRNATFKAISGFFIVLGGASTVAGAALALPPWINSLNCNPGPRTSCGGVGIAVGLGSLAAGVGIPLLAISIPSWAVANRNQNIAERELNSRTSSKEQGRLQFHLSPLRNGLTTGITLEF